MSDDVFQQLFFFSEFTYPLTFYISGKALLSRLTISSENILLLVIYVARSRIDGAETPKRASGLVSQLPSQVRRLPSYASRQLVFSFLVRGLQCCLCHKALSFLVSLFTVAVAVRGPSMPSLDSDDELDDDAEGDDDDESWLPSFV